MLVAYNTINNKPQCKFERIGRNPCEFRETLLSPGKDFGKFEDHYARESHFLGKTLLQAFREIEIMCSVKIKPQIPKPGGL